MPHTSPLPSGGRLTLRSSRTGRYRLRSGCFALLPCSFILYSVAVRPVAYLNVRTVFAGCWCRSPAWTLWDCSPEIGYSAARDASRCRQLISPASTCVLPQQKQFCPTINPDSAKARSWLFLRCSVKAHAMSPRFQFPPFMRTNLSAFLESGHLCADTQTPFGKRIIPSRCTRVPFACSYTEPAICFHPGPGRTTRRSSARPTAWFFSVLFIVFLCAVGRCSTLRCASLHAKP